MPVVLITGAGRGLGLEFARQYAADGWRVIATCRDPARADALRALGPAVEIHRLDVEDFAATTALARTALANEAIDVAIANAGVMLGRDMTPESIDVAAWERTFRVNTMAPLAFAGAFAPHVARSVEKKMLAVSSWVSSVTLNTRPGHYIYRSTKSALNAVWRSFATDHPELIAATLSPGLTRTDMIRYDMSRWPDALEPAVAVGGLRKAIARLTPADSGGLFHYTGERLAF